MHSTAFLVLAVVALVIVGALVLLVLFEPGLKYSVTPPPVPLESKGFLTLLGLLADSGVYRRSRIEVLTNGDVFYEAELEAIRAARRSVNLEAYIFAKGEISGRFMEALAERARAGVKVNVVLDAVGSFTTWNKYLKPLRDAGARVRWYQPLRWYTVRRLNNRTHRELLIVDGKVGFVGGAGIADPWLKPTPKEPQWRDTVFRIEGELVTGLQTTFAENWLESADEILAGEEYFPSVHDESGDDSTGTTCGLVVISSPSAGRATRARILFQTLLASARQSVEITSPYFLPDHSVRAELLRAIRERGVRVTILVPGEHADHLLTRRSSRALYGDLLSGGAEIHEYLPSMHHAKVLVIDSAWCVFGTTNFDNRSFGLNDEVNVATCSRDLVARLQEDFRNDLAQSRRMTHKEWAARPLTEKIVEWLTFFLRRNS
jgi:cardiolipin synthase A/B